MWTRKKLEQIANKLSQREEERKKKEQKPSEQEIAANITNAVIQREKDIQQFIEHDIEKRKLKEEKGTPILFRNIPWGSNVNNVVQFFPELSLTPKYAKQSSTIHTFMPLQSVIPLNSTNVILQNNYLSVICNNKPCNYSVANHKLDELRLYFALVPQEGQLVYDPQYTSLYAAQYVFCLHSDLCYGGTDYKGGEPSSDAKYNSWDYGFKENEKNYTNDIESFSKKLTSIYGLYDTKESFLYPLQNVFYWYGQNNTELILSNTHQVEQTNNSYFVSDEITITYLWLTGDELLQKADAVANPEKNIMDGCDGL